MKRHLLALALSVATVLSASAENTKSPIKWVDTMIGTGAHYSSDAAGLWGTVRKQKPLPTSKRGTMAGYDQAHDPGQCIPAVLVPHGMNNWVAQTEDTEQKEIAPYYYADEEIQGFRGSHWISGSMTQDYGSFTIMPLGEQLVMNPLERASRFSHDEEVSTPAYYSVRLKDYGIFAEMTATSRAAIFRFTYEKAGDVYFVVNHNSDEGQGRISYDSKTQTISGSNPIHRIYQGWGEYAGYDGHFTVSIDKKILEGGTKENGAYVKFHVKAGETVLVKAASSFTSIEGARKNLAAEIPAWDFDDVRAQLTKTWEETLSKVEAKSSDEALMTSFYTSLYHGAFLPRVINDCDGAYPSYAGGETIKNTKGAYYDDYSMWDTYRAMHPLFCLLEPEKAGDMIQSLLDKYDDGGWLPIFPCWNSYTSEMIGDHCCSLVADAWFKGVRNFDIDKAYKALRQNAYELPSSFADYEQGKGRRALENYMKLGYIPVQDPVAEAFHKKEQTSRTMEYAYDDYVLSLLARDLGHDSVANDLLKRSKNYVNVFNPELGWVDGRNDDGTFVGGDPFSFQKYICEGKPCHYTWYVPHDVEGLIDLIGGKKAFIEKLDYLFDNNLYWHGNEPCHQIAYLYDYAGAPEKTQQRVHEIMLREYGLAADGLAGNDDAGQMSAWYVFSALGFYPVCPGKPEYAIGTPAFEEVTLHLSSGRDFRIIAHNVSSGNIYIGRATLNGKPLTTPFLKHSDMVGGGVLDVFMTSKE